MDFVHNREKWIKVSNQITFNDKAVNNHRIHNRIEGAIQCLHEITRLSADDDRQSSACRTKMQSSGALAPMQAGYQY